MWLPRVSTWRELLMNDKALRRREKLEPPTNNCEFEITFSCWFIMQKKQLSAVDVSWAGETEHSARTIMRSSQLVEWRWLNRNVVQRIGCGITEKRGWQHHRRTGCGVLSTKIFAEPCIEKLHNAKSAFMLSDCDGDRGKCKDIAYLICYAKMMTNENRKVDRCVQV